jgi:hypothetical protein
VGGLGEVTRKNRSEKEVQIGHQRCEELVGGINEDDMRSSLLESPKVKTQQKRNKSPYRLRGEKSIETEQDNVIKVEEATMSAPPPRPEPPPFEPIDPLVRPRGLPILVPRDLAALDMPSNLPKFWVTKDEDPSRHMEMYIKKLANSLITNPGYCLVWFSTTLQGEAYEWYRDHPEEHFREWIQMQREFLNEFRSKVG